MENILFDSFRSWRSFMAEASRKTLSGIFGILSGTACGIASLIAYAARQVNAFCRRETVAAAIIGVIIIALSAMLVATFVTERSARVLAERQRDSIAYRNTLLMQAYEPSDSTYIYNVYESK